jgi:large subunit ribosomal protein L29
MKKLKIKELKDAEILAQVNDARKELREARFQYAVSRTLEPNPKVIRNLKRKIARLLTEKREREINSTKAKN